MAHFNLLTPSEAERLDLLAEECAEVIQAICKIKRHGYASRHPDGGPSNRQHLQKELGQVRLAIDLMLERGDISESEIDRAHHAKWLTLDRWLHHNSIHGVQEDSGHGK